MSVLLHNLALASAFGAAAGGFVLLIGLPKRKRRREQPAGYADAYVGASDDGGPMIHPITGVDHSPFAGDSGDFGGGGSDGGWGGDGGGGDGGGGDGGGGD